MRRSGILNAPLLGLIGRLGHTDVVVVADCGLPVPPGVPVVDLAVVQGLPPIRPVLEALLDELVVERATVAAEADGSAFDALVRDRVAAVDVVAHEDLKAMVGRAAFVVRTGEATPWANAVLHMGVPFGG